MIVPCTGLAPLRTDPSGEGKMERGAFLKTAALASADSLKTRLAAREFP
jgi:hypothetical protein